MSHAVREVGLIELDQMDVRRNRFLIQRGSPVERSAMMFPLRRAHGPTDDITPETRPGYDATCLMTQTDVKDKRLAGDPEIFNQISGRSQPVSEITRRALTTCQITYFLLYILMMMLASSQAEIIAKPGPSSGILVQEAPGFILTDKRIITQKVCTSVDPQTSIEKRYQPQGIQSPEIKEWYRMHLQIAKARATEILTQARKPFVPASAVSGKRPKRFIGGLIAGLIFSVLGTVVSTTVSAANSVSIKTLATEIELLHANMEAIHHELELQKEGLIDLFATVNDTVVTVNTHSELISRSIDLHQAHDTFKRELMFIQEPILFHTLSFLNEVQNGMTDLSHGYIPLYFVSTDMIKSLLRRVSGASVEDFQINLAFEMGSAMPLYINTEDLEVCFLLAIPHVSSRNVFQMKNIHNVGTWKGDIHVQIKTPEIIAYQPWVADLYAIPILNDCTRFKDNNFQCSGNPFIYDTTHALCGIEFQKHGSEKCEVNMRKAEGENEVRAILVKDEWLVSTNAKNMSVFYESQVMNKIVALPAPVSLIRVPPNSRITIGKTTLYPVGTELWEGNVESVDAFQNQEIPINPDLKFLLEHKPNHTLHMKIKRNNISVENFDYSEEDNILLNNRYAISATEIGIYLLSGISLTWLAALTAQVVRSSRREKQQIPAVLRLIRRDLQQAV